MSKLEAYKIWLGQGAAQTEAGRTTRSQAMRVIERNLAELGMPYQDLDAAWQADRFASLRDRLKAMRQNARQGGQDYRILMPESTKPLNRLSNWGSWLAQYGRFLAGEPPVSGKDADRIRQYVLEQYIETGREAGHSHTEVLVRDVNDALGLNQAWPNICQALAGPKFQELAQVPAPEQKGADQSSATVFRFDLRSDGVSPPALEASITEQRGPATGNTSPLPVNLILYGPPGTGKTYATAAEALRLCGEPVPEDRAAVMAAYQRLVSEERIAFVTFHQSLSYEEFIEGRQPTTDAGDGAEGTGFRLETKPGIFRRIAKRAQDNRGPVHGENAVSLAGRQVFKMSIGRAHGTVDSDVFDAAIKDGYTYLDWEDIDWSADKYSSAAAILETCQSEGKLEGPVTSQSGQVLHTDTFRNRLSINDIIVVSKGNSLIRAIGEVIGDYEYVPRPDGRFSHRRKVRWLWLNLDGVPVHEIYHTNFIQPTIYRLRQDGLNVTALERYLNSSLPEAKTDPQAFVLIIDEINRANISKVFGELITLLEPDKRLGQANALTLQLPYSGDHFGVPSNLHILGTMNTADRSIALLDTALRRRFSFREMMPKPSVLAQAAAETGLNLPLLLERMNARIEYLYDREHQIGHAYFTSCTSRRDVDAVMRHKVIPLLAEYFFEDWAKSAAVLGDLEPHEGPIKGGFLTRERLKAPPGFEESDAALRYRWALRGEDEGFDYERLLAP
ncbi:AAA family ATPase [Xinfangfangia sp. CPCC 101601]|uniref:AAA family ATPase n=1 Tax=Pseudogemmobacter lacusdianii TaxID=3069608 RepID=A0ABU0W3B8_9RHOB|nr:AAA family ATPase [Xinfangfangia sp. CPCC 101601]MDQ2067960.1 AAA family ATPase [Xinfangfangia sp. CPCC 101601]